MDPQKTIHIKQEETDCAPDERGLMSDATLAMAHQQTTYIKQEETDCAPDEPGLTFPEDPLKPEVPDLSIKPDPELKFHVATSENDFPGDTLGMNLSEFIKEDPELNLEADETENIVLASTSSAYNTMRLIGYREESCDTSYEETVNQGLLNSKLGIDSEELASFAMFVEEEEAEEEKNSFGTRLKCCLRENNRLKFSCSSCLQSFPSKYRLIMHVFVHIEGVQPPVYVCKSCGQVFPSHDSLNKHLKISEVDQAVSADKSEKFDFRGDYISNFLEGDQEGSVREQTEGQCSSKQTGKISEIQFNHTCNMHTVTCNSDMRDLHDNDGTSNISRNVNDHTVLLPAKRRQNSIVSGEYVTEFGNQKRSPIIDTGGRIPTCDICGKSFTRFSSIKNQVLIHTGTRPHKCNICGKSFTRLEHLQTHSLIHTGSKPHTCDICGKSFTCASYLQKHALIHTGSRPHKCNICGKSFTHSNTLQKHTLIHTGMKPHECNICGKSFNRLSNLKKHVLGHTGTKSHKCNICGKMFTQLWYLKAHALIHTGSQPYKCNICGKSFTWSNYLKTRINTHRYET